MLDNKGPTKDALDALITLDAWRKTIESEWKRVTLTNNLLHIGMKYDQRTQGYDVVVKINNQMYETHVSYADCAKCGDGGHIREAVSRLFTNTIMEELQSRWSI
jgi:hypothetical protein